MLNCYFRRVKTEHHQLEVPKPFAQVHTFLSGRVRGITAQRLESLFFQERVFINGLVAQKHQPIAKGDWVELLHSPVAIVATDMPLAILYEDADIIVIDKASGMPVHPGLGHYSSTLLNALVYHFEQTDQPLDFIKKGLVHRLDRATSGLMVFAKNESSRVALDLQFQAKSVGRMYLAAVWGRLAAPAGTIAQPLGRVPGDPMKIAVCTDGSFGKPATTQFEVLATQATISLVALYPTTGRTHQLRIHMHYLGHGIVGDERYQQPMPPAAPQPDRLALHASCLGFAHPQSGIPMYFQSAWPKNLHPIYTPTAEQEVVMAARCPRHWEERAALLQFT